MAHQNTGVHQINRNSYHWFFSVACGSLCFAVAACIELWFEFHSSWKKCRKAIIWRRIFNIGKSKYMEKKSLSHAAHRKHIKENYVDTTNKMHMHHSVSQLRGFFEKLTLICQFLHNISYFSDIICQIMRGLISYRRKHGAAI